MRIRIVGAMVALIAALLTVGSVNRSAAQDHVVQITRSGLDAALAATLAQDPRVDFPQAIRFEALRFRHAAGLGIEGRARFLDPATGGYPPPDIRFSGSVPMTWWRVDTGALTIPLATIDSIAPVPGGADPDSQAADAIRDSLGTGVGTLLSRLSFSTGLDPGRRWIIGSSQSTPEALVFGLRPR
ncbi:MAG: hypothetical protein MUF73_16315 [Rhodobacteraceae bacterium]|jgi:hypothetical protein|nr:hypothetical protein [Paracoccaceae bacterium]